MRNFKKHKGMLLSTEAILVIVTMAIVTVFFMSMSPPMMESGKAEGIARKYIIKAQQQGYLSSEDKAELTNRLEAIGAKNISIQTTDSKVKYGDDVNLVVEYDTEVKEIKNNKDAFPGFEVNIKRVKIDKSTIGTAT